MSSVFNSLAQEIKQDSIKTIPLEEVVVKASRSETRIGDMPSSIQVISSKQIQGAQASLSLEESLRNVPGVFVSNRFNFSQGDRISIRGIGTRSQFGVRGIKIIYDGIPLTFPDGLTQINNIDLSSLGRIEVLKGASSVLYGNSSGGIIYLTSEATPEEKLIITPSYLLGSFGLQKAQVKASGTIGKFKYLINTNRTYSDGFRDFSTSLIYNFNSNFNYSINERSSLSMVINGNDSPYLLNPSSLDKKTAKEDPSSSRQFNKLQGAGKKTRQLQAGLGYQLKIKNNQSLEVTGFGVVRDLFNPIPGRIIDLERQSGGLRTTYNKNFILNELNIGIKAGYDFEYQVDERTESENQGITEETLATLKKEDILKNVQKGPALLAQKESIMGNGIFAKLDINFQKLALTAGARLDNYSFKVSDQFMEDGADNSGSKSFQQINPAVGFVYHFSRVFNLFSNYSSSFQTPSANEFGNLPTGVGGFNEDLKPETIKSFEAGIRGKLFKNVFSYEVSAFYMNIHNQLIGYQTANVNSDEVYYRNSGKTRNVGFETFFSFSPQSFWGIDISYAFNEFRFVDYSLQTEGGDYQLKGNKVPGVPQDRFFTAIKFYPVKGLTAEINFQQVGKYFTNDFNGPEKEGDLKDFINKSYSQLDFRMAYEHQFGKIFPKIYGGINNILDQRYNGSIVPNAAGNRFFEPAPGIHWYLGIQIPIVVVN